MQVFLYMRENFNYQLVNCQTKKNFFITQFDETVLKHKFHDQTKIGNVNMIEQWPLIE